MVAVGLNAFFSLFSQCEVDGEALMLEIYDTAGQEEFSSLRDTYIKASEGFLLVYSITALRTFQHAQKLLAHIQKMKGQNAPVVMIGNKKDMEDQREVKKEEADQFATEQGIKLVEASAKTCENVQESIHALVRLVAAAKKGGTDAKTRGERKGCILL